MDFIDQASSIALGEIIGHERTCYILFCGFDIVFVLMSEFNFYRKESLHCAEQVFQVVCLALNIQGIYFE